MRSTQILTEMSTKEMSWGKMRRARGTHSSSALFVTNFKERMEALHSIFPVCHYDLLRESRISARFISTYIRRSDEITLLLTLKLGVLPECLLG